MTKVLDLTSTISLLEAVWVLAAAVGVGAMIVLAVQGYKRLRWLHTSDEDGVLRFQATHNLDKALLLLLVTELYLVAGLGAMTLPPNPAPMPAWSPAWGTGAALVGALGFTLWLAGLLMRHDRRIAALLDAQARETAPPTPARPRILLIDDYAPGRRAMRLALEAAGYEVVERDDARGLLGAVARYRPSLIIMDLLLPGISGDVAAQALRALGDETPIILHTGQWPAAVGPSLDAWAQEIGVQAILMKGTSARPLEAMRAQVERLVPRQEVAP
jgi:CheY-like chemotaxis protein